MKRNIEVEIFGKKYTVRYKSIAWYVIMILDGIYWFTLCAFLIFDIWAFISLLILFLD